MRSSARPTGAQPAGATPPAPTPPAAKAPAQQVDIVIPVTIQQRDPAVSVIRLHSFLASTFPFTARVTIAVSKGSHGSWFTAAELAATFSEVSAIRTGGPGRGAALRQAWAASQSDVLAYLDADLSVDPAALVPLVSPLLAGEADVAIGTRLAPGVHPQVRPRRQVPSCGHSLLLQAGFGTGFADPQCGFKAIRRDHARDLLPLTRDDDWFFDTQLLRLALRAGLRIREIPVNHARDTRRTRFGRLLATRRPAMGSGQQTR